eukprot:6871985-Pyramimonas_sp.AAC.1
MALGLLHGDPHGGLARRLVVVVDVLGLGSSRWLIEDRVRLADADRLQGLGEPLRPLLAPESRASVANQAPHSGC